jgi:hypothetical protein
MRRTASDRWTRQVRLVNSGNHLGEPLQTSARSGRLLDRREAGPRPSLRAALRCRVSARGFDLQLARHGAEGWRATFYPAGRAHSQTSAVGSAWECQPWTVVQRAAWEAEGGVRVTAPAPRILLVVNGDGELKGKAVRHACRARGMMKHTVTRKALGPILLTLVLAAACAWPTGAAACTTPPKPANLPPATVSSHCQSIDSHDVDVDGQAAYGNPFAPFDQLGRPAHSDLEGHEAGHGEPEAGSLGAPRPWEMRAALSGDRLGVLR